MSQILSETWWPCPIFCWSTYIISRILYRNNKKFEILYAGEIFYNYKTLPMVESTIPTFSKHIALYSSCRDWSWMDITINFASTKQSTTVKNVTRRSFKAYQATPTTLMIIVSKFRSRVWHNLFCVVLHFFRKYLSQKPHS